MNGFNFLGGVASFIIYSNSAALVGRSIPRDKLEIINIELEQDVMIRAIHDVKGIDMGNTLVRYKAEVDFDGRELTRSYLEKQNLKLLLEVTFRTHVDKCTDVFVVVWLNVKLIALGNESRADYKRYGNIPFEAR